MRALGPSSIFESRRSTAVLKAVSDLAAAVRPAAAAALSGALLIAAFPPYDLAPVAWFSLVPLYWAIAGKSGARAFLLALLTGTIFIYGLFGWITAVPGFRPLHHAILVLYMGSWIGLFGICLSRTTSRFGLFVALAAAPFFWVAVEFVRSNMFFLALPWGILAHSQYRVIPIIQISALTGAYGLSFLIALVNSALFALLYPLVGPGNNSSPFPLTMSTRQRWGLVFLASAALAATFFYGSLNTVSRWPGKSIRVAVVQGNIDQQKKWDPRYAMFIMDRYERLTREAALGRPELIVWPEAATPRYLNKNSLLYPAVKKLARQSGAYLAIGTAGHPKFNSTDTGPNVDYNSVILIPPEGRSSKWQRYDKVRPLPFGEYLPLRKVIPWSWIGVPTPGHCLRGKKTTVLSTPDFRFGTPICWEDIFPGLIRSFVREGAQFIVNCTNEAWFGKTAAPYQFLSMSVFRAVENRRFVVRCANTGISCVIDPCGRVIDRVRDGEGNDIFVTGVMTAQVTLLDSRTVYTRYGDWPAGMSLVFSAALILLWLRRRRDES